jgi:hypothetical protein
MIGGKFAENSIYIHIQAVLKSISLNSFSGRLVEILFKSFLSFFAQVDQLSVMFDKQEFSY